MFCINCGVHLNSTDKRCPNCGYEKQLLAGGNGFWDIISGYSQHFEDDTVEERNVEIQQESEIEAHTIPQKLFWGRVPTVFVALLIILMCGSLYLTIQNNRSLHKKISKMEEQVFSLVEVSKENESLKKRVSELEIQLKECETQNGSEEKISSDEIEGRQVW